MKGAEGWKGVAEERIAAPISPPERGQGAGPGRACSLRSRAPGGGAASSRGGANEMQIQAEVGASEKEGPAVRT